MSGEVETELKADACRAGEESSDNRRRIARLVEGQCSHGDDARASELSKSTLGDTYFTVRVATSYTMTKLWSVRVLTNAILRPSGDHFGPLCTPHSVMNGFSPRSISLAGRSGATRAR